MAAARTRTWQRGLQTTAVAPLMPSSVRMDLSGAKFTFLIRKRSMSRHKREAIPRGMPVEHPWRVPLAQSSVTTSGLHVDLTADERVRSRLARVAGLESLPRLSASFDVTLHGRGGLRVAGRGSA